ncbi:MAG TPA: hypothetical protein ENJ77_01465 [Candidatus Moranbacteria bacterium]|nr:hypothetical protein [Candidatus Moranbacteria bacterium]
MAQMYAKWKKEQKQWKQAQKEQEEKDKKIRLIGQNWDEITPELGRIRNKVKDFRSEADRSIADLRQRWLNNLREEERQAQKITEQKRDFLRQNQREYFTDLAKETQKKQFAANLALGAVGAGDSSAAIMATKGLQKEAEREKKEFCARYRAKWPSSSKSDARPLS